MKKLIAITIVASSMVMACTNTQERRTASDSLYTTSDAVDSMGRVDVTTPDEYNRNRVPGTVAVLRTDDSAFVMKALQGSMMEVELGKLAQQNTSNPRVKAFGEMMINDHQSAGNELRQIIGEKGWNIRTDDHSGHRDELKKLSDEKGADFDKKYISMMEKDHKKDIEEFEKAGEKLADPELKAFIQKTLPVLHKHMDSVNSINGRIK